MTLSGRPTSSRRSTPIQFSSANNCARRYRAVNERRRSRPKLLRRPRWHRRKHRGRKKKSDINKVITLFTITLGGEMEITAKQVKELREATGAGIMDSKKALEESQGDVEKAVRILREKGLAGAQKKMGRVASEGIVDAYIHLNNRIGVLLEVNWETDFVARNEDYRCIVDDIALYLAASSPLYVSPEDIPENILEVEKEINRARAIKEGKPEQGVDKIVEGRLKTL